MKPDAMTSSPLSSSIHTPVLRERCVELLAPALQARAVVFVDATVGMGGHSEAFLQQFPNIHLVGIDRDADALGIASKRLAAFADRVQLVHAVYDELPQVLDDLGIGSVAGILFDLGVSSLQLDRDERGFSYARDTPLDMRMDASSPLTAQIVLATYSDEELTRIFRNFGEERLAQRYARAIVRARQQNPITSSEQLVAIIAHATPAALRRSGHPAKRIFQALRIEVNEELAVLERAIPAALEALAPGGRLVALAYHSLEDRIVKRALTLVSSSSAPVDLPIEPAESKPRFRLLVRGSETAPDDEKRTNPRAKSVRLRAVERMEMAA